MKKSNFYIILFSGAFILAFSSCGNKKKNESNNPNSIAEQKVTEVSPQVVFENDYALVSKVSLAPGEFQKVHEGENRVIYSLTDYSIDWEEQGETLGAKSWKKGDVHYHKAGKHSARNNGTTTAEWLVFSKKNTDLPYCEGKTNENDVNSVSAGFTNVLLDNNDFKITEVTLPKGESIAMHSGINRIIYSITEYQIMYKSNEEGNSKKQFQRGEIHWHDACQHALQNIGETEAKFLVVGYKQKNE
ncbi:MAG TPA: hypothetical protein DDY13_07335 [Cytophagales bacterium]|jgi:quercetin dioxygenase-like cupin family protein|nr:hypothetical protein [Cytophagales bacterium]